MYLYEPCLQVKKERIIKKLNNLMSDFKKKEEEKKVRSTTIGKVYFWESLQDIERAIFDLIESERREKYVMCRDWECLSSSEKWSYF